MSTENPLIPERTSLSAIFSNLSKAAERQQLPETSERYRNLADSYHQKSSQPTDLSTMKSKIEESLAGTYPLVQKRAEEVEDRGVLRALKWGEKVTTIQKALITRFVSKGDELIEGKDFFICEACGFIFLGTESPKICPVCKAPESRFSKVQ